MEIRGIIHISVSIIPKALSVPSPIVTNGPTRANPDIDFSPLPIADCVRTPASELFFVEELPGLPIPGHIALFNGKTYSMALMNIIPFRLLLTKITEFFLSIPLPILTSNSGSMNIQ